MARERRPATAYVAAMLSAPILLLYLLVWLVVVPGGLYLIIRTAVERGIRRAA